jgi:MFS transporter, OFA family, oxalate/formate antiporter
MSKEHANTSEIRTQLPLLATAMLACMCGLNTLPFFSIGLFVKPISEEFGWDRASVAGVTLATSAAAALVAPLVGALADRWGARRITIASYVAITIPVGAIAFLPPSLLAYYAGYVAMALFGAAATPVTLTRVINQWFDRDRGLALGLTLSGSGLFGFLCLPALAAVIEAYGWRAGYVAMAALPLFVTPLLLSFFRDRPLTDMSPAPKADAGSSITLALRSRQFWVIAITFFFVTFAVTGSFSSLIPALTDGGYSTTEAATAVSLFGVAIVIGRIGVGYLVDRFWPPGVAAVAIALPVMSCILLATGTPPLPVAAVAAFLIGIAAGAEFDLIAFLTARYFGLGNYGKLYALQFVAFSLGGGIAPLLFGASFDLVGSYTPMFIGSGFFFALGAMALLTLEPWPRRSN